MTVHPPIPVVMTFSGSDPTGGAGVQADIEALASMGCHAAPVITAVTAQDTHDVKAYSIVDPVLLIEQARAVLEDIPIAAFKIGMLGNVQVVEVVHTLLVDYPDIPVVFDPVIKAGGGGSLADDDVIEAMVPLLFPLATVLTPNSIEARLLASEADSLEACAHAILEEGCEYLLVTGTHENTPYVVNNLYGDGRRIESFKWERLPGNYHGSGCTLAASIAGLIAQEIDPLTAIRQAQEYTWESLKHGYRIGMGQYVPNRLFWARDDEDTDES